MTGVQALERAAPTKPVRPGGAFIDFFNRTLAKPFRWTYEGKPLAASRNNCL
jgi:hypothetical protein